MPLSLAQPGEYIVTGIGGKRGMIARLQSMGILIGDTINVIKPPPGPVIIAKGETRIGIGVGMANRIYVVPKMGNG